MKRRPPAPSFDVWPGRRQRRFRRLLVEVLEPRRLLSMDGLIGPAPLEPSFAVALTENVEGNLAAYYAAAQPATDACRVTRSSSVAGQESDFADLPTGLFQVDVTGRLRVNIWTRGATLPVAAQLRALEADVVVAASDIISWKLGWISGTCRP